MKNETPEEFVKKRVAHINTKEAYAYAVANPDFPGQMRQIKEAKVVLLCSRLEEVLPDVRSLIEKIFESVSLITEQTKVAAVYLLLGKAFSNLQSSLILCRAGKNIEAMELSRSGKEAVDLAMLFWDDTNKPLLDKWFKGKIISNSDAREFQHKFLNRELAEQLEGEQPIKNMLADGYKVMSIYTHSAYAGLLDSVDVFKLDFDFSQNSGYHYSVNNFHIIEDLLVKIILELKDSFLHLKDRESYALAGKLFNLFDPGLSKEELENVLSKYKA